MDNSDETWLDKMLNKCAGFNRLINDSTTRRRATKRASRWSNQAPVAPAPPNISMWLSQETAAFPSSDHYNLFQKRKSTGNAYELDETEISAPPPPSWPTNETSNPNTPNFTNSNETCLRIAEVRGSVYPSAPIISQSAIRSTRWDKQQPNFKQCLSSNIVNEQQQHFRTSSPPREEHQGNMTPNNFTHSYEYTQTSLRISILPTNYPMSQLTKKQMEWIQKALLNKIIEQSDKIKVKPQFNGFHCNSGYITLNCADKATAIWTRTIIPTLKMWGGDLLTTIDEEPLKLTKLFRCVFPDAKSDEAGRILDLIKAQNAGLNVNNWRLVKRINLENNSVALLYAIDQQSADQLEKVKEKIAFRFDTLPVLILPLDDSQRGEHNKIPAKPLDETRKFRTKHAQGDTREFYSKRKKS